MFSQSADEPAPDQSPAPIGMRELPPQPARPVMPAYTMPGPVPVEATPGPAVEDSVIAKDDHLEGTFTSRGTIVVMGSVKGRIEAVRVRIEDGARVDADVIVDEAIVAGEFTGTLTCRQRLEAHASGRINGRVETYKLMLHEGASVEGEMHMLTEAPRDASETIRGTAPLRGEPRTGAKDEGRTEAPSPSASPGAGSSPSATAEGATPSSIGPAKVSGAAPAKAAPGVTPSSAAKAAPGVTPSSAAKHGTSAIATTGNASTAPTTSTPSAAGPEVSASQARNSIVETLRLETLRVAPRTTTAGARPTSTTSPGGTVSNGSRGRSGTVTTGF